MNASNISETVFRTLQELNDEKAQKRLPTTIYLSILLVVGVIGNLLVLCVYGPSLKKNNFRTFTVCLAVIDIVACCVYIPVEIVDQVLPLMFFSQVACKLGRFIGRTANIGSACIIVVIAFERHRKICLTSKKQIGNKLARGLCLVALVISVALSWPALVIEGLKEKKKGNVTGYDCGTADGIRKTIYPFVYTIVLLSLYSGFFLILIVLYSLVIRKIKINSKALRESPEDRAVKTRPVTKIMLGFTIAFILSYLPHFGLELNGTIKRGNYGPDTALTLAILPVLSRSYLINNVINPIILSVGDQRFRVNCWKLLRSCCTPARMLCHRIGGKETDWKDTSQSHSNTEDTFSVDVL